MAEFFQRVADTRAFILRKPGSRRMLPLLMMGAVLMAGCDGAGNSVSVDGNVRLDGTPITAEIQIEQLDADGNRVGRSAIAYADSSGDFATLIEPANGASRPLECRIVVRTSEVTSSGLLSAFDENSGPTKAIHLRRAIRDGDSLAILLTR